ncbi:glycosyltransferase family 2 protein [Alcaligenes endophyticus]|uniref:Glycosyltransferase family 2 protein n=1 Tax=Alcaligenes endophyticus TaxID=1929088 RepID=A0ABT8EFR6_9BURK|nr:glycosyltransferase family 2 protein [Alcaligenes endophyticus]MCX5590209.1 glycosyltransferase family 2 protein [Alcaligenes endophyticus]MDN4120128.1 glycosyltransferase family 2 protein [Alcaligenes endophyticus]
MKFSIIIPLYNVERFIDRCLISCKNQTYKNYEIIIIDDKSTDNSKYIADLWKRDNENIKIISHKNNLGTFHARESGVKISIGEYIIFLDPDDTLSPETLEKINTITTKKPDIILFGTDQHQKLKIYQRKPKVPKVHGYLNESKIKKILYYPGFNYGTSGKCYRKECVHNAFTNLHIEKTERLVYGEDSLLFSEVLSIAKSIDYCSENLYTYFKSPDSITETTDKEKIIYNIQQLSFISNILLQKKEKTYIHSRVAKKLISDRFILKNKIEPLLKNRIINHINQLKLTGNIRSAIKFIIHLGIGKI